jgi:hypothetical protein
MIIMEDGIIKFGNPARRKNRPFVYQILKTNYNHLNGDVINTYCIQKINSKTLQYFVEVCPKDGFEYIIGAEDIGKKNLSLKDCRDIVEEVLSYGI